MTKEAERWHLAFFNASKAGAEKRFQYAKAHLAELNAVRQEEIRRIADELYRAGLEEQAKKFVELAYMHLHNKDMVRYTEIRKQYRTLIQQLTYVNMMEDKYND